MVFLFNLINTLINPFPLIAECNSKRFKKATINNKSNVLVKLQESLKSLKQYKPLEKPFINPLSKTP